MKVSVIIPTYNRAYCLGRAIESVLAQTYTDLELIVVDDGSTDNTRFLVEEYARKDDRIRYVSMPGNSGVSAARNYGMECANGEFLAFQDSDDYWHNEKLEKQMKAIESTGADFSYTYIEYDAKDNIRCIIPDESIPHTSMNGDILARVLHSNLIGAPTLVMHRRCYEKIGAFDTTLPALEDYDYAIRLASWFKAAFVPEVLLTASATDGGISSNSANYYIASCLLIGRYKKELLSYNEFNYRVQVLMDNADKLGVRDKVIAMLEKVLQSYN